MNPNKKIIGYTAGTYDMFHIGHLNILKQAKQHCDYLIVGVNSDELTMKYKKHLPIVPDDERRQIVESIECVDEVIDVNNQDKLHAQKITGYDVIFVGDDHKGEESWIELESKLERFNAHIHYFGYTKHTSSTKLRDALDILAETIR